MKFLEYIRLALYEIWQNKMRTFLTLIGIIVGIAAVMIIVFIVQGAETFLLEEFKKLTPLDIVHVYPRYDSQTHRFRAKITEEDINLIKEKESSRVERIAPQYRNSSKISYRSEEEDCYVNATTSEFYQIYRLKLAKGRFLTEEDVDDFQQVVVLDNQAAREVFKGVEPLGKKIHLYNTTFKVIGVLKEEEESVLPVGSKNSQVFIPVSVRERLGGFKNRYRLLVQLKDASLAKLEPNRITTLLNLRHGLAEDGRSKFQVRYFIGNELKQLNIIKLVLLILLGGAASITLLVAGIGVMNIMLVIVTERTREIGLRKALGATKRDILAQFIIESIILCLVGGIIGVGMGYLSSDIIRKIANDFVDVQVGVPSWAVVLAIIFTTGVGIFFGFYPALKAAKKDPVEALRYE